MVEEFDRSNVLYNGFNSFRLMSIRVIKSQMHFVKTAFSHRLQKFIPLKSDSTVIQPADDNS